MQGLALQVKSSLKMCKLSIFRLVCVYIICQVCLHTQAKFVQRWMCHMSEEKLNTNARADLQRKENESQYHSDSLNCGEAGLASQNNENQPQRGNRAVGSDNGWQFRLSRLGGIHRPVKQLQAQHLAYVEAHGQRLEARLQENRQHKNQILEEITQLEQELIGLIEEAETRRKEEK